MRSCDGGVLAREAVEVRTNVREPAWIDAIHTPGAVLPVGDKPGVLQDTQMLGDGRPADGKIGSQVADRAWASLQRLEDLTPSPVTKRIQDKSVRSHLP